MIESIFSSEILTKYGSSKFAFDPLCASCLFALDFFSVDRLLALLFRSRLRLSALAGVSSINGSSRLDELKLPHRLGSAANSADMSHEVLLDEFLCHTMRIFLVVFLLVVLSPSLLLRLVTVPKVDLLLGFVFETWQTDLKCFFLDAFSHVFFECSLDLQSLVTELEDRFGSLVGCRNEGTVILFVFEYFHSRGLRLEAVIHSFVQRHIFSFHLER